MTEAASLEAHRVVAALAHDHSAGEGLVVDLDAKRPLPAVESVLLDEVEVVHSSNLEPNEEKKKLIKFQVEHSGVSIPSRGRVETCLDLVLRKKKHLVSVECNSSSPLLRPPWTGAAAQSDFSSETSDVYTAAPTNREHVQKQLWVSA